MSNKTINLEEFLNGYKTVEITLEDKKRIFREPKVVELKLGVNTAELLRRMLIEGEWSAFYEIFMGELSMSQQDELIKQIFD
ncbi:MAG: hypothetical protein LBU27_08875 [Candidatus Peribacteria bacterium]|jgi:hypothetical protein|nr:hypothetical protein [Candidatus Peribacteria bacterium]